MPVVIIAIKCNSRIISYQKKKLMETVEHVVNVRETEKYENSPQYVKFTTVNSPQYVKFITVCEIHYR